MPTVSLVEICARTDVCTWPITTDIALEPNVLQFIAQALDVFRCHQGNWIFRVLLKMCCVWRDRASIEGNCSVTGINA
jgi:hypothetical protein